MACAEALDEQVSLFSSTPLSSSPPLMFYKHWFFVWLDAIHLSSCLSLLMGKTSSVSQKEKQVSVLMKINLPED